MKPARLEVVAFGPFADRQVVDIDSLGELGLFVIAGPTGAGKTSLFDAMCYALYGALPGARSGLRQPRSDHADPSVRSEVVFDFDAAGERWRVRRRPAHLRPKKRGSGTIEDPAEAVLSRLDPAGWQAVTTRAPEVDARCVELVGLDAAQFQRVVLLPQGRFQQLLHAKSSERRDLLRTLFASDAFERVEDRLVEMAKVAASAAEAALGERRRSLAEAEQELDVLVAALADSGVVVPDPVVPILAPEQPEPEPAVAATAGLAAIEHRLHAEIAPALARLAAERDVASRAARRAAESVAQARSHHARRARIAELEFARAELESERPARQRAADTIAGARRVAPVVVAAERVSRLVADADHQGAVVVGAARRLAEALDAAEVDAVVEAEPSALAATEAVEAMLDTVARRLEALGADLTAAVADQIRVHDLEREHSALSEAVAALEMRRSALDAEVADLMASAARAERQLADAQGASARAEVLVVAAEHAEAAAALGRERDHLIAAIEAADAEVAELTCRADSLAEQVGALAAELAAEQLVAARRGELEGAARDARASLDHRTRLDQVRVDVGAAETAVQVAHAEVAATVEAFVAGAARRLSEALVPGEPCPVCGSVDHPGVQLALDLAAPAPVAAPVEAAEVDHAQSRLQAAVARLSAVRTQRSELVDLLGEQADQPLAELAARAHSATVDLARAERAVVRVDELELVHGRATELVRAARVEVAEAQSRVRTRETELAAVRARLGDLSGAPLEELDGAAAAARGQAVAALTAGRQAERLLERLAGLESRRAAADSQLAQAHLDLAQQRATAERVALDTARLTADLVDRAGTSDPRARLALVRAAQDSVAQMQSAVTRAAAVAAELERGRGELDAALATAALGALDQALELHLPDERVTALAAELDQWQRELAVVEGALASLHEQDLGGGPPADLAEAEAQAERSAEVLAVLTGLEATAADRRARIAVACAAVHELDSSAGPARERAELLHQVAEVAKGNNVRKISLEAWVLSSHLRDVVAQANLHLGPMTGGRFRLAVADDIINPRGLAGLDLEVDDALTGFRRPTSSLSGGETFQASLALALGLADVVSAGSSGIRVDAVFIDEGFGSLDPEALDLAIDTLDGLRSRGALVGVVTHVEALKQALPVGVEVTRRPDGRGSQVRQPGVIPTDPATVGGTRRGALAAVPDVA